MEENKPTLDPQEENEQPEQQEPAAREQDTTQNTEENDPQAELEAHLKEINDKYLRLAAEFDNYRKRMAKEKIDWIRNASEELIIHLLEVLDDTDRAVQQMEQTEDPKMIKEGVHLVFQKLRKKLESKGLEEIPAINEPFDTDLHEAITEIPAPTEDLKGKVVDQVSKGYKLNDKVIRHSKVVVGK